MTSKVKGQKGFTLIELLIVVVIIGILAAIAIPRFGETRERAYVSAMQSDLDQVTTQMEMCYQDAEDPAFTYANCDLQDLGVPEGEDGYSTGVILELQETQDELGYHVEATHDALDPEDYCAYSNHPDHEGEPFYNSIWCDTSAGGGGDDGTDDT